MFLCIIQNCNAKIMKRRIEGIQFVTILSYFSPQHFYVRFSFFLRGLYFSFYSSIAFFLFRSSEFSFIQNMDISWSAYQKRQCPLLVPVCHIFFHSLALSASWKKNKQIAIITAISHKHSTYDAMRCALKPHQTKPWTPTK